MVLRILLIAALLFVMFAVYVRMAPSDPTVWHVDPADADDPGHGGYLLKAEDSPVWSEPPEQVMARLAQIAIATDRTYALAGTPETAHMTFVTRSLVMGFPDYTTAKAVADGEGTRITLFARLRFGSADLGVNRARVEAWLARLSEELPPR